MTATVETKIPDPVREGLARGWSVIEATTLCEDVTLETFVTAWRQLDAIAVAPAISIS
jgi:hypothetical protein